MLPRSLSLLLCALLIVPFTGCTSARIFQKKVPQPVVKAPAQIEAERQAADLIARTLESPVELKPVASSLSTSLGAPQKSLLDVRVFSLPQAAVDSNYALRQEVVSYQRRIVKLNSQLDSLQGKDIDGTGISIAGPGLFTTIVILAILGVAFPPVFTILGFAYRRLKQTTSTIVQQIDESAKDPENQVVIDKIKNSLSKTMDVAHKKVVSSLQKL